MDWSFERVAGPFGSPTVGIAWDGSGVLFSHPERNLILRYNPGDGQVSEFRKYTNGAAVWRLRRTASSTVRSSSRGVSCATTRRARPRP